MPARAAEQGLAAWRVVRRQWLEGLRVVRGDRSLTVLMVVFAVSALGEGVMGTMFVIWVRTILHGGALQVGWFMSAQAVGGIVGGLAVGAISARIAPSRLGWMSVLCFATLDIALFTYPLAFHAVWIGLGIMVIVGLPAAGIGSGLISVLQVASPDAYRGRIFGALGTARALASLLGTAIAGVFGGIVGPIAMLAVFQGGGYLLAGLLLVLASTAPIARIRRVDEHLVGTEA
jgi:MFS family permease